MYSMIYADQNSTFEEHKWMVVWLIDWFKKNEQKIDPMKYLIVGLGNIGSEYDHTRHNIGFDIVDHMAQSHDAVWKTSTLGDVCKIKHKGRTLLLLKPSTYMNRSGKAVNYWMQKEKINLDKVLVLVDDLNLDFGKIRMRKKGSDGGHNGLKDINQTLGSNYARLRVGIGDQFNKGRQIDYVLGKWTAEEQKSLGAIIEKCSNASLSFAAIGAQFTMNEYNN